MLRVDRCRDMDELINFWARSGSWSGCRNRIASSDIAQASELCSLAQFGVFLALFRINLRQTRTQYSNEKPQHSSGAHFRKSLSKCRILSPKNSYLSISHVNSSNTAASLDRSITSVPTNDGSFYIQSNCVYIPNQFEPLLDTNGSCHFTASRRITFVGSTCALPSGLLVSVVSTDYILASDHTTQISKQRVSSTFAISDVHSKLNYCNSFYSHLLNSRINRIQQIQNSLAHTVAKVPTPYVLLSVLYLSVNSHSSHYTHASSLSLLPSTTLFHFRLNPYLFQKSFLPQTADI